MLLCYGECSGRAERRKKCVFICVPHRDPSIFHFCLYITYHVRLVLASHVHITNSLSLSLR